MNETLRLINKIQSSTPVKFIYVSDPGWWQWTFKDKLTSEHYNTPEEAVIGCLNFFSSFFDEVDTLCKQLNAYTEEEKND